MSRWIKVDATTPNKPAIVRLGMDCGCSRGDAFLAWFRLYSWLDEQTADGTVMTDRGEVDAVARLPGCAASLERSGWLSFFDGVMTVTNWCEHNGSCAKRRSQNAQRMARARHPSIPVRNKSAQTVI